MDSLIINKQKFKINELDNLINGKRDGDFYSVQRFNF